ncbi:hypothetical protein [Legionella sp. km772]|uniref:hypothetical protein n=1 Tax=Legionella sp. km772 TaxID=2498111 RepID=UPI000F8E3D8C|nr:hypothetical protein [Legionella sp. km772]RUR05221.1 hypothetical protein ELY15_14575 [Legionella sp. km772]
MKSLVEIKELLALSGKPRSVPDPLMAFFLYLKTVNSKQGTLKAFAMNTKELGDLAVIIEEMVDYCTQDLRFQIALSKWDDSAKLNHWTFLEFDFKGSLNNPALDILICDPLGFQQSLVLANLISWSLEFGRLSEHCQLKIYIPSDTLQISGRSCAYFVTDSIARLSNQEQFNPLYDYMSSNQQEEQQEIAQSTLLHFRESLAMAYTKEELDEIYKFNLVVSSLPTRLLRTQHSVETLTKDILAVEERSLEIVNKKGDTAAESINKHSFFVTNRQQEQEYRNMRVNIKMEKLGAQIAEVAAEMTAEEEEIDLFNEAVERHRLPALAEFLNTQMTLRSAVYC